MEEARSLLSDAKPTWITHSLEPLLDLWEGSWGRVEALAQRVLETSRRTENRWDEWASHHLDKCFTVRWVAGGRPVDEGGRPVAEGPPRSCEG